uniref:MULE domain-containing protein n=1 Tax=Heterorhabditis bacteriophora TaxID=37862 RepID=A0A1I7X084_HETBA
MTAYVPAPISFRPSQQRGRDIAFYPLPCQSKLAYEALKDGARSAFGKIPYVYIVNGNFITNPEIPVNPHSWTPRNSARALAGRETIDVGNYLRQNANMTPKQAQHMLLKRNAQSDKSNLRCVTDNEDLLLLDDGNMIVVGSRMLWNAVFHTLNGKSFFVIQGGQAIAMFFALIKASQRATYDRLFKWSHDELAQLGDLYHLTLPGVKFLADFELRAMKAIESQLVIEVLGCTFHYKKCIYQRRDAVGLRSNAASDALVSTYFRGFGVMPFLAPHLFNISECLPPPRLPSDKPTEALLDNFRTYYRNTWLPPNGIFHKYLDHSKNFYSRTTNAVEGSHTRIRAAFPSESFLFQPLLFLLLRSEIMTTEITVNGTKRLVDKDELWELANQNENVQLNIGEWRIQTRYELKIYDADAFITHANKYYSEVPPDFIQTASKLWLACIYTVKKFYLDINVHLTSYNALKYFVKLACNLGLDCKKVDEVNHAISGLHFQSIPSMTYAYDNDAKTKLSGTKYNGENRVVGQHTVSQQLASVYDPLGFLVPLLLPAKIFLQSLWATDYAWDTVLQHGHSTRWRDIMNDINHWEKRIPRHVHKGHHPATIIVFADASQHAIAACAYLKTADDCHLIMAKSKYLTSKEYQLFLKWR